MASSAFPMLRKVDLWTGGHLTDAESKMAIVVNRGPRPVYDSVSLWSARLSLPPNQPLSSPALITSSGPVG